MFILCAAFVQAQTVSGPAFERWHGDKYSMFIHFGVYSSLGGVWDGEPVKRGYSEQIQSHAGIYSDVYENVAARFNPSLFDADAIADLAKEAGMRSIVITSKHHDGFCLFRTSTTDFNSWDTPEVPRDFIAELSAACRRKGVKFGLYFSIIDWHDPYGNPISSHNADPVTPEHHALNMKQVEELCSNYGSISELWFDMGSLTPDQSKDLYDLVHRLQPGCMVSGRLGNDCYDFCVMGDNSYPDGTLKTAWQTPASMFNETWGYRSWQVRGDPAAKASEKLHSLLGTVSHGGNFLLNIGPRGDGTVVDFERDVLLKIGAWLKVNGESVYDTEAFAWPGVDGWGFCTRKGDNLYITPSKLAADTTVVIRTGAARLVGAEHLDDGLKVEARSSGGVTRVKIYAYDACAMPRVTRLRFDRPVEEPAPLTVQGRKPQLTAANSVPDYSYSCFDYYTNYKSVTAYNWHFAAPASSMVLTYPDTYRGRTVTLTVDGTPVTAELSEGEAVRLTGTEAVWGEPSFAVTEYGIGSATPSAALEGKGGFTWKKAVEGEPAMRVPDGGSVFVRRTVSVPEDCDIVVEVVSRGGVSFWLDGAEIARHLNPYGCTERRERYLLHLTPGEHVLFSQSFNMGGKASSVFGIGPASENAVYRTEVALPSQLKGGQSHVLTLKPAAVTDPHADIELSNIEIRLK